MLELADRHALGACAARRRGSNPLRGTKNAKTSYSDRKK